MRLKGSTLFSIAVLIGDSLLIPVSYLAAYHLRSQIGNIGGWEFGERFSPWFLVIMTLGYLLSFYLFDLFLHIKIHRHLNTMAKLILAVSVASISVSFIHYSLFLFPIGRGIFFLANTFIILLAFFCRFICFQSFKYLIKPFRLLIVGSGDKGKEIARILQSNGNDFEVVGFANGIRRAEKKKNGSGPEILGDKSQLLSLIERHRIEQIVVATDIEENSHLTKDILKARLLGIETVDMADVYKDIMKKIPIDHVQENWFLKEKGFERSNNVLALRAKRIVDCIFSSVLLILSVPLWILIALAIKISSRGPIFYVQQRVGKNDTRFRLYKFRSMIDQAEQNGAVWADKDDARITSVGRILRKAHLDELPQLLNVLKGEMSLVGPRPERPQFVNNLNKKIPYYSLRHFVKPGLTGWAQINYPYASSLKDSKEKLEYDLYYISHLSLFTDLRILLGTVKRVFSLKKGETRGH